MSEKTPNPVLLETPQGPFTLRDLFVGFALAGRCARDDGSSPDAEDAQCCHFQAAAMLKERVAWLEPEGVEAINLQPAKCEKCGGGSIAWEHVEGRRADSGNHFADRDWLHTRKDEHLDYRCLRCGWEWETGIVGDGV